MTEEIQRFVDALLTMDRLAAQEVLNQRAEENDVLTFIEEVVVVALEHIGDEWLNGKLALSQVYMAGRVCEELVDMILPPEAPDRKDQPKMAICVLKDHHTLGKNIVYSLLRASGFELQDYGIIGVDELVQRIEDDEVRMVLISVLMLPSALKVADVRAKLRARNLDVKIVVGGAPFRFDKMLWKNVNADAMCEGASDVLATIDKLMREV